VGPSFVSGQTREGITRTGRRCRLPLSHTLILDNGPQYTATATVFYAHELGLVPLTTPAYSPQSNGLAEAFVKTVKRDYVDGAELRDAESVLAQLSGWIEDYNTRAPHSALGMRSPADYRAATTLSSSR
jgi:putative transposase